MNLFVLFLVIFVCIVLYFLVFRKHKNFKYNCVALFTGAPKTGKTALSVREARRLYRKQLFLYYLLIPFKWLKLSKNDFKEYIKYKPMLYSSIPLRYVKYNEFTKDMLLRNVRLPNKSIVLIDEASLVADSQLYKDKLVNEKLLLFVKLFGHYTHGGYLILNTHAISDLHYSFKRCIGTYFFITKCIRFPFFSVAYVRECVFSEDMTSVNNFNTDTDDSMKRVLIRSRTFKSYDPYALSSFTDNKPYQVDYKHKVLTKKDSLKVTNLVTLQNFESLRIENEKE